RKKKKVKGPPQTKNSLMVLNEMQPGLKYELVEQTQGSNGNSPSFTYELEFKGVMYRGSGSSKKIAKRNTATAALQRQIQFEQPHVIASCFVPMIPTAMDFTSDDLDFYQQPYMVPIPQVYKHFFKLPMNQQIQLPVTPGPQVDQPNSNGQQNQPIIKMEIDSPASKPNPVQLVNELAGPSLKYNCVTKVGDQKSHYFVMEVEMNGKKYEGQGKNKKTAKVGAALKILLDVYGMNMTSPDQQAVQSNAASMDLGHPGKLPDLVFNLVQEKFNSLVQDLKKGPQDYSKHKVLAGIVMTHTDVSEGTVISVATGTKCVGGEYISNQGAALFDCHAEIVAKRGLRKYLYDQLLVRSQLSESDTIFEEIEGGGYKLKSDVFFHLYINTSPCGDARIFSPHESKESGDNHPNRKSRGQLRTKIENGEGTIPVEDDKLVMESNRDNVQQTWDGVIAGERLLTMSCSDKIAKWNVVGVQGALLSVFLEPVYLSSIILGSLYHVEHFNRGVFERANEAMASISDQFQIQAPYRVHRPLLSSVTNPAKRMAKRAPTFCLHWTLRDDQPIIVNANTGKQGEGASSNLCKKEMLKQYLLLCSVKEISKRANVAVYAEETYADLKSTATQYQEVKNKLMKGFSNIRCGKWVGKPSEVDLFTA
uniref:A to I editase domain-containing protein n=1 Tax=Ciona savignyi TaxID=51511 RepID=H2Z8X8_CIOSA